MLLSPLADAARRLPTTGGRKTFRQYHGGIARFGENKPPRSESEISKEGLPPYALVVDDDHAILTHAIDILEEAGFRTLMALNAEEALSALEFHGDEVTLLFTDVEMPGVMNGFELARRVAARWPEIGVLVASGNCQPSDGDLPEGAIFVGKPFSAEIVHGRVHELLPDGKEPDLLLRLMSS